MSGSKVSDEVRQEIAEAFRGGQDKKAIAQRFGLSESFCYAVARKAGISQRKAVPFGEPRELDADIETYLQTLFDFREYCRQRGLRFRNEFAAAVAAHRQKLGETPVKP